MVTASAPGKVHLIGEHAVVYGHPAIIAAVEKRIYVTAERADKVVLRDDRWNSRREWHVEECMEASDYASNLWKKCSGKRSFSDIVSWAKDGGKFNNYWKAMIGTVLSMTGADSGISIHITRCDIPSGSGLGSSSASAVAIAKAVSEAYGKKMPREMINSIAFECEKFIHGTPSGGDNSASCFGGLVWFQKAQPANIIVPLDYGKLENFLFVNAGVPEKSTGELVQMVRNMPENVRNPKMEEIEKMTHEMKHVLKDRDYGRLKEIMNRTNEILSSLGLSTHATEEIYEAVASIGGGAKMCGACGGGIVLCWHEDVKKLKDVIKKLGYESFEADLAVEGVKAE